MFSSLFNFFKKIYLKIKNWIKKKIEYISDSRIYSFFFIIFFNIFYLPLLIIRLKKKILFFIALSFLPNNLFIFVGCSYLRFNVPKTHIIFFLVFIITFLVIYLIRKKIKEKKLKKSFDFVKLFISFKLLYKFPKYFLKKMYLKYTFFLNFKKNAFISNSKIKYYIYKIKNNIFILYLTETIKKFFNFFKNLLK